MPRRNRVKPTPADLAQAMAKAHEESVAIREKALEYVIADTQAKLQKLRDGAAMALNEKVSPPGHHTGDTDTSFGSYGASGCDSTAGETASGDEA